MKYDSFYHYTGHEALKSIFGRQNGRNGLQPDWRFISLGHAHGLPDKAHEGAIWGMLSPRPKAFTETFWHDDTSFFGDCLRRARHHLSPTFMLRAQIAPEDDIYVADWSVHLRDDFYGTKASAEQVVHDVKKAYWESLVPLSAYKPGAYRLPEVVCFSPVPQERLSVETVIPASEIDRYIKTGRFDRKALERDRKKKQESDRRALALINGF